MISVLNSVKINDKASVDYHNEVITFVHEASHQIDNSNDVIRAYVHDILIPIQC